MRKNQALPIQKKNIKQKVGEGYIKWKYFLCRFCAF